MNLEKKARVEWSQDLNAYYRCWISLVIFSKEKITSTASTFATSIQIPNNSCPTDQSQSTCGQWCIVMIFFIAKYEIICWTICIFNQVCLLHYLLLHFTKICLFHIKFFQTTIFQSSKFYNIYIPSCNHRTFWFDSQSILSFPDGKEITNTHFLIF